MTIVLILLLALILYKSKIYIFKTNFNDEYISKETTTSIKGIFVILVFLTHVIQYVSFNSIIDTPYNIIQYKMGQLIVCMFFFYSGYGIYESIKNKGSKYIESFPKNRLFKVLLHFDIAVLIYLILDLILNIKVTIPKILLSLIGWDSLGNSNWFMFAILFAYLITYLVFKFIKNEKANLIVLFIFIIAYMLVIANFKESWWYDTIICYPLGMLFSVYKDKFEKIINSNLKYYITLFISIVLLFVFHEIRNILGFALTSSIFSFIILLLTRKINISNKYLDWFGKNVFNIYITTYFNDNYFKIHSNQ